MWPNEYSIVYLLMGFIPLAYAGVLAVKFGLKELSSLRFLGVLFLWLGYHLSPWFSYVSGEMWDYYLIVPYLVDDALLFSNLAMYAFLIGYGLIFRKKHTRIRKTTPAQLSLPTIKPYWVFWMATVVLVVTIILSGGIAEFWASSYDRGHAQFEERDTARRAMHALTVLRLPLQLALAVMAALLILKSGKSRLNILLGLFGLLVASSSSLWSFSRAAGFPFLLLGFLALRAGAPKAKFIGIATLLIVFMLGAVGYGQRSNFNPGVGNFIHASIAHWSSSVSGKEVYSADNKFINPLDATAAFTRKAEIRYMEQPELFEMMAKLIWNLNPLPSEFFPIYELGTGLTEAMGTTGSVGLTTPALAEIYYVFGMAGFLCVALFGGVCGWFERYAIRQPCLTSALAIVLVFVSFGVGLHSGIRAWTRPLVYGFVLLVIENLVSRIRKTTSKGAK